jgi:hypothetical protein
MIYCFTDGRVDHRKDFYIGQGWLGLVNAGVPEAKKAWANIRAYILEATKPDIP